MQEELNKKLAKWRGLKDFHIYADDTGNYHKIQFIDPEHSQICIVSDAFHLSLDVCLKYLIPPLWICNITLMDGLFWSVEVSIPDFHGFGKHGDGKALDENLALSLCLAIERMIDGKKK